VVRGKDTFQLRPQLSLHGLGARQDVIVLCEFLLFFVKLYGMYEAPWALYYFLNGNKNKPLGNLVFYMYTVHTERKEGSETNGHGTPPIETLFHNFISCQYSNLCFSMDLWNRRGALFSMGKTTFMSPQTAHKRESDGGRGKQQGRERSEVEFLSNLWGLGTE
jgi:hypothetical protein